jgi:hypothetical protein
MEWRWRMLQHLGKLVKLFALREVLDSIGLARYLGSKARWGEEGVISK